jgi:Holliday junction resolvase RusA-like endonuclease
MIESIPVTAQMDFTINIEPPRATHQEKAVAVVRGKPVFYERKRLKDARKLLMQSLQPYIPEKPLDGALYLSTTWAFKATSKKRDGEYKTTKPDTDNLVKLLKDCMTECGFWHDDAQVAVERTVKIWSTYPCIEVWIETLGQDT